MKIISRFLQVNSEINMSKYCVVCKKQYVPGVYSRSFHCIPKNEEQRAKWMKILGITSCPVNGRVCSDHFESSSYLPNHDYKSNIRKLLPNAVPTLLKKTVSIVDNLQASSSNRFSIIHLVNSTSQAVMIPSNKTVQTNENNFSVPFVDLVDDTSDASNDEEEIEEFSPVASPAPDLHPKFVCEFRQNVALKGNNVYEDSFYWPNTKVCSTDKQNSIVNSNFQKTTEVENSLQQSNVNYSTNNVLESTAEKKIISESDNECLSDEIDNRNLKKRRSGGDFHALLGSVQKFKWKDGTVTNTLTKKDFTSEKAWYDFLQFTNLKRKQVEAMQKRYLRRDKAVKRLKDTIKTLKGRGMEDAEIWSL